MKMNLRKKKDLLRNTICLLIKNYYLNYPSLREGNFLGVLVSSNSKDRIDKYELKLPTDKTFTQVHGNITLHYSVYLNQKIVMLETLTPEELLSEGHQEELTAYKGVMVSKSHKDRDMFKINLLNSINKGGFLNIKNIPIYLQIIIYVVAIAIVLGIVLAIVK